MKVRRVGLGRVWDCMLCTCVNEEGGDGEGVDSSEPSLLSYTLRYISLVEVGIVCQLREPMNLCACVREEGGDGEGVGEGGDTSNVLW
jgi:hypothetical protein